MAKQLVFREIFDTGADAEAVGEALVEKADISEGTFFVDGAGTTDSTNKVSTWTGRNERITEYYDGLTIRYKIGEVGQSTTTLDINELGAKTIYRYGTTKLTTQFPVGSIIHLIYHTSLNDGCWMCSDYDSNTNTYQRVYPTTTNAEYPITARYATTTGSSYYAEYGRYSTGVTLNPSTKTITALKFKGDLTGNADTATKATQDANGNNIANTYETKANVAKKVSKDGIALGIQDGLLHLFIDGEAVGTGVTLPSGASGDVVGNVDSDNTIVLNGNLVDGTYTIKYEMADGSKVDIGNLVLDTNVYYSVSFIPTNCTINNNATQVVKGQSYSATITANSGYELKTVTVTMGGSPVTVTNGVINIANVTGNIEITAVAEAVSNDALDSAINADGTPFVGTNGEKGYKTGVRISGTDGSEKVQTGCMATGFIAVTSGQKAIVENITPHSTDTNNVLVFYDEGFSKVANTTLGSTSFVENPSTGVYVIRPAKMAAASSIRYIRFSCATITENSSVTVTDK